MIETVPVLAGLYGLMFLSSVSDYYCNHSMFWSLYPTCPNLSVASGFLAAFVVGFGSARPISTLTFFCWLSLLCIVLAGLLAAGRGGGFGAHAVLTAQFSRFLVSGGVVGGAVLIMAAIRLYDAKKFVHAGCLVAMAVLIAGLIVWRESSTISAVPRWLEWLGLLISALVYGVFVRHKLSVGQARLNT